jgi:large conductance mechanosensitive channel
MLQEFKKFAMRGNVIDLAVGVIIGGAFGKIVTSLVSDMIMPLLGLIIGKINFSNLKFVVRPASTGVDELAVRYGQFLQSILDFLIIAFSIFLFIKFVNRFKKKEEEQPKLPSKEEVLLTEIRDILKERA